MKNVGMFENNSKDPRQDFKPLNLQKKPTPAPPTRKTYDTKTKMAQGSIKKSSKPGLTKNKR
jgi:hypothetical protein